MMNGSPRDGTQPPDWGIPPLAAKPGLDQSVMCIVCVVCVVCIVMELDLVRLNLRQKKKMKKCFAIDENVCTLIVKCF